MTWQEQFDKKFWELSRITKSIPPPEKQLSSEIKAFIQSTILSTIDECAGEEKKRQFPLAEKVLDRIYDCEVVAYNQKRNEILAIRKKYE